MRAFPPPSSFAPHSPLLSLDNVINIGRPLARLKLPRRLQFVFDFVPAFGDDRIHLGYNAMTLSIQQSGSWSPTAVHFTKQPCSGSGPVSLHSGRRNLQNAGGLIN